MKSLQACLLVLSAVLFGSMAAADPIYTWTDENGKVHFSSKNDDSRAQLADLPPINRGDVKVAKVRKVSCDKHGGVDCTAGPDSDGSVICYDGFRGASARFRFNCVTPKLEITEVTDPDETGRFSVYVRNVKTVNAERVELAYRPSAAVEFLLKGPDQIERQGLEEYVFIPTSPEFEVADRVSHGDLFLRCSNCP